MSAFSAIFLWTPPFNFLTCHIMVVSLNYNWFQGSPVPALLLCKPLTSTSDYRPCRYSIEHTLFLL